jgi:hypothetical protein
LSYLASSSTCGPFNHTLSQLLTQSQLPSGLESRRSMCQSNRVVLRLIAPIACQHNVSAY